MKNVSVNLKPIRSHLKESKHSTGKEFQSLDQFNCVRKETVDMHILIASRSGNSDRKIMQPIRM